MAMILLIMSLSLSPLISHYKVNAPENHGYYMTSTTLCGQLKEEIYI